MEPVQVQEKIAYHPAVCYHNAKGPIKLRAAEHSGRCSILQSEESYRVEGRAQHTGMTACTKAC